MKRFRPSPALVISLIALFVALGGTSYAVTSLPANSVGTVQLKNGAVTAAKLNASALSGYLKQGATLPSGHTETGDWGSGEFYGASGGAAANRTTYTFPVPLAKGIDEVHTRIVTGASAKHCPGVGHADRGFLCFYTGTAYNSTGILSVSNPAGGPGDADVRGFSLLLGGTVDGAWTITGTYAVTAP